MTAEYDIKPIDIAKLMIEIEKRFEVTIYDEDVHTFKTVNDVVKYVDTMAQLYYFRVQNYQMLKRHQLIEVNA